MSRGQETERPEWYGTEIRVSPVTNRRELHYPNKAKIAKMTVSFLCLAIAILIVLLSVTGAVVYRVWVRNRVGVCELSNGLMDVCTGVYNLTGGMLGWFCAVTEVGRVWGNAQLPP